MAFLDGIEDLLYVREFERHLEWLLSLAEAAESLPEDQSVTTVRLHTSADETDPPLLQEGMTVNTGETVKLPSNTLSVGDRVSFVVKGSLNLT